MSDFKLEGTVYKIFDEQQISASFKKREFVLVTDEQYPQHIKFELVQDRCSLIEGYKVNDIITVHFNLSGREWMPKDGGDAKYFVSLKAWRIEKPATSAQAPTGSAPFPTAEPPTEEIGDDLPF